MKNYHIIKVTYLGATNNKGSRVKMYSERFLKSKTIPFNHGIGNILEIAKNYLLRNGFEIIGQAEGKDSDYIITETFKEL